MTSDPTTLDLDQLHDQLHERSPQDIVRWAGQTFGNGLVMTSSFGAQSALMLHLVTRIVPDIPIILIDTGYLFPQTYRFANDLADRLELNLKVFRPRMTTGYLEAIHGQLWEQGVEGLTQYHQITKIEPMQRALRELGATAWLAGLRMQQTDHRASLRVVEKQNEIYKVHPILKWTSKQVHEYLKANDLPYHPLVEQGYASIGDTHSTRKLTEGMSERDARFHGLKQECGLHLPTSAQEDESRASSGL